MKSLIIRMLLLLGVMIPVWSYAINPVDPNLIPAGKNILNYFESIYGQNTVTAISNNQSRYAQTIFDCTGKWPAMIGEDLCGWNATKFSSDYQLNVQRAINRSIDYWNNKHGMVQIQFHWPNPLTPGGQFADSQEHLTAAQWNNIVTPGTSEYNTMMSELNWHLNYLQQLTDQNIPVIWRPLHEIDGGWFWWVNKDDPAKTVQLWKILYNHIVNVRGMHNLIWVWSSTEINPIEFGTAYRKQFYPGDQYVDIIGVDLYNWDINTGTRAYWNGTVSYKDVFNIIQAVAPSKMVALCEGQALPNAQNTQNNNPNFARWLYALPWWAYSCQYVNQYPHAYYITADELPSFGSPPQCQPVSGVSITNCPAGNLSVGATHQLNSVLTPSNVCNSNRSWSSSNTSVATVNASGVVTAVSNGTAVITVTTASNNHTATCNVTVSGTTPPTGLTIQAEDWSSQAGGSNSTAQPGYTGAGYYDMGSATTDFVQYTFTAPAGAYNLSIRYANGSTGNRACTVTTDGSSAAASFAPTGAWTTWVESTASVTLTGTSHTIRIQVASASGGPNVDRLVLSPTGTTPTQFTLTTNTTGSGSISLSPAGGTYNSGTVVSATAVPAAGWQFTGWSGAATGTTNPTNITMNANKTLTATFTQGPPAGGGYQYYRFTCTATNDNQMFMNGVDIMVGTTAHNLSGSWQVLGMPTTATKTLNVGSQVEATAVRINTVFNTNRAPRDYVVEGSNNNSTWTVLLQETGVPATFWPANSSITIPFTGGGGGARVADPAQVKAGSGEGAAIVFPNPATHEVSLHGTALPAQVEISNLLGQRVKSFFTKDGKVDVSELSKGIYLFKVNNRIIRMIKE